MTADKPDEIADVRLLSKAAMEVEGLSELRYEISRYAASEFRVVGEALHVAGHLFGTDRRDGQSPFGHGSDETVAISLLSRIAAQLIDGAANLFETEQAYAACALLRQLVEVEYLAYAFATHDTDAVRWVRSTKQERLTFFTPKKLREASEGRFRGKDYGYHCEMGGHPVPGAWFLFPPNPERDGLFMSDLLGHTGRIWEHFVEWASEHDHGRPILERTGAMRKRFMEWEKIDPLIDLPPPP